MVFYHSLRLQQATEWWISDNTYIHYINFVSYLKLVHLTLLLACNDLLGLDVAYTLVIKRLPYIQTIHSSVFFVRQRRWSGKRREEKFVRSAWAFSLLLIKSTAALSVRGSGPLLDAELQFWKEGGKNLIWSVKFFSVYEQIGGVISVVLNLEA